jgi:hypothetical protein
MADENVQQSSREPEIEFFQFKVGEYDGSHYLTSTLITTIGKVTLETNIEMPFTITTLDGDYSTGDTGKNISLYNNKPYPAINFWFGIEEIELFSDATMSISHDLYNKFSQFLDANLTITGPVEFNWGELREYDNPRAQTVNLNNPSGGARQKKRKTRRANRKKSRRISRRV